MIDVYTPRDADEEWLYNRIERNKIPMVSDHDVDWFCDAVLYAINEGADVATARVQSFDWLMRNIHESR